MLTNPKGNPATMDNPKFSFNISRIEVKVGRKYHSGFISNGVANGLRIFFGCAGNKTLKLNKTVTNPKIQIGNI